ncbi:nitroreductase family protein [Amycolatopsis sp. CA-230715]|uniref:nitroreductase family protein n=1 Tax=Amycolatopsis sp. CA-230715 TaxID=2745196 RepID=UPI001C02875E|nr:nitroreductase family protein [Amycolatopsis sp. CA-230715]QWF83706.1 hypothetical protein HUW46_07149 [Amycolatopsis sp. CA-230715]
MTPEELLTTTRAVRKRLDLTRDVPLELVKRALTIGLQAPSGSNRQQWQWLVVTDAGQRAALSDVYRRGWQEYMDLQQVTDDSATYQRIRSSSEYLAEHMQDVPVLLVPCLDTGSAELPEGNQAGLWASLLPAVWSYMLAARNLGLGTVWTTLHLRHEKEAAEVLGLPETVHQGALIPTAYYTGTGFKPAERKPIDEVLHLNRW